MSLVARHLIGLETSDDVERLIVKHFLEMRNEPFPVGRIAMDPEAKVIVDPAAPDLGEGFLYHRERFRVTGAEMVSQKKTEIRHHGEFRPHREAAPCLVVAFTILGAGLFKERKIEGVAGRSAHHVGEFDRDAQGGGLDLGALFHPGLVQLGGDQLDPGTPRDGFLREISAREKGMFVRRQHHRHGPAAAAGHRLGHLHVDLVDIGTLLPVDLDRKEARVDDRRDLGILEGLVFHHVAPVAGGVADAEEDRLALLLRLGKGRLSPRPPVDRIARVLQQIGALFKDEPVEFPSPVRRQFRDLFGRGQGGTGFSQEGRHGGQQEGNQKEKRDREKGESPGHPAESHQFPEAASPTKRPDAPFIGLSQLEKS